jgi:hypothetical protein
MQNVEVLMRNGAIREQGCARVRIPSQGTTRCRAAQIGVLISPQLVR